MNLRKSRPEDPDINLTPLIDVVFLLLIFFMVSTTFDKASEIAIDLPKAQTSETKEENDAIEVSVDASGNYYVNGRQLVNAQTATIRQALRNAAGDRTEPRVVINGDGAVDYQAIITLMDAARQLGFARLSFTARRTEGDD
ncbi:MAG: biopolymer transporter ExbD [Pseudomonadota bacterium]